jgi:hypothetical protein
VARFPLVGVSAAQCDALTTAMNAATIDTALLDALLRGGLQRTEMGQAMAEGLAMRCELATVMHDDERAAWRSVLGCALSLPEAVWTVECLAERPRLGVAAAAGDPLLQRVRDALYRPVDVSHAEWQTRLAKRRLRAPGVDSRQLALEHQRAQLPRFTKAARHAWVEAQLRDLAPAASADALQRGMHLIRRHERLDARLLDARAGLPAVFDASCGDAGDKEDPASIAAIQARLLAMAAPDCADPLPSAAAPAEVPKHPLADQLLQVAREASLDTPSAVTPLGRYDSVSRALVSLLSGPWQLDQWAAAGFDLAYATTVASRWMDSTHLPTPARVADAANAFGRTEAWMLPEHAVHCTPLDGALDSAMASHAAATRALLGSPPASTAVALPGQCWEERWQVAGLFRERAAAIGSFLARQQASVTATDDTRSASESLDIPVQREVTTPTPSATWATTRARAGALTEPGRLAPSAAGAATLPFGASAQFMIPMQGYLPVKILAPLLEGIPRAAWWDAFDWQVPRTLAGLRGAVQDLFGHADIVLDQRAPSLDALERFFASAAVLRWFDRIRDLPAAEGARRNLARGGEDIRVYAFTLMLQHLLRRTRSTGTNDDRAAMHLLSRIGTQCVAYLQGLDGTPTDAFTGAFDRLVTRSRIPAGSSGSPPTEAMLLDHAARLRDAHGVPLKVKPDHAYVRPWLVEGTPAVLDEATFISLSLADTLLADVMVALRRRLDDYRFGKHWAWREPGPTPQQWRDHLDRRAAVQKTRWETELGVLVHQVAASLGRYLALQASNTAPINTGINDLRVLTRAVIEPLLQLYASLDLPMQWVDPQYANAYKTIMAFFDLTGSTLSSDPGTGLDAPALGGDAQRRLRALLPPDTATLPLPQAVLQHLLGQADYPADAAALEHAILRLHRGQRSRLLIGQLLGVDSDAVGPDLARRFFRALANVDDTQTLGDWRAVLLRETDWQVSPAEWLTLQPANALAGAWHAPHMANPRDGLVRWIRAAIAATLRARAPTGLSVRWTWIVEGPGALDDWLGSDAGAQAVWDTLRTVVPGGLPLSRLDQRASLSLPTRSAIVSAAVEAQLQLPPGHDPSDRAAAGNADGAPALSLAIDLSGRYPALDATEALAFAAALLDPDARAAPSERAPLQFPLLSGEATSSPLQHAGTPSLEPVDALLQRFGLALLQPDRNDTDTPALLASEAWDLMSRTRQFADYCRPLLAQVGWYGGATGQDASPRSAQTLLARLMLEQYIGREAIDALRERFASPQVTEETYTGLASRVHTLIAQRQPDASPAARDLLYWMLARELEQPTLLVSGIPVWLYYGRSLQALAFHHGAALLEALQPGACERAHFDEVCTLPAQLARPPRHAGELDALHDAWARALLPAAVLYATAQGVIEPSHTDAVSAEQARAALDHVQAQQRLHALHVEQLDARPPQRKDIAAHTLTTAGVDPRYWPQRPDQLPAGYLQTHGIAPSEGVAHQQSLEKAQTAFFHPFPVEGHATAYDGLQDLVVADAYGVVDAPSTATLFERTFTLYQQRLETGLAGIIGMLLDALPEVDRHVLAHATCLPLRVQHAGRDADQGVLLRCIPQAAGLPTVHFEVFPSAGVVRRLPVGAAGEMLELDGFLTGRLARSDDPARWHALSALTLLPSDTAVQGEGPNKRDMVAQAAAKHLWQPFLARVKQAALARRTGLERLHEEDRHLRLALLEFVVPFFKCVEEISTHDSAAAVDCTIDGVFALLPLGGFVASTVRVLDSAGVRTLHALCEEAGGALLTLAAGLAEQSGVFALRDAARATFWVGSTAFNSALGAAGWLRRILRSGTLLDPAAMATEHALAGGVADAPRWRAMAEQRPSLGVARLADGSVHPVSADGLQWYRWDTVSQRPYGPPLARLDWIGEHLPEAIPVRDTGHGLEINLGDTDDVALLQRSPTQWEVVVQGISYRLDATDAWLRRHPHEPLPEEPGVLEPAGACRKERALESTGCPTGLRLRFVPYQATALSATASLTELGGHALARREYTLATRVMVAADDSQTEVQLMVHEGKVQKWIVQTPRRGPAVGKLVPLSAEEAIALGVPFVLEYPQHLRGTLASDPALDLPNSVGVAERDALYQQMPVIDVDALLPGVADHRRMRGVVIAGHVYLEPDPGVFYRAPLPSDMTGGTGLTFTRLRSERGTPVVGDGSPPVMQSGAVEGDAGGVAETQEGLLVVVNEGDPPLPDVHIRGGDRSEIDAYLRQVETYRMARLNGAMEQDRENIARLAFGHLRAQFSSEQLERYPHYDAYRDACRATGRPNALTRYADSVLSGASAQRVFVRLGRHLIPDWTALASSSEEERQGVADVLNQLLPVRGKEAHWTALTGDTLATDAASRQLLDQLNGANLAFAEVTLRDGRRVVYYALSGGKKAAQVKLQDAWQLPGDTRFVNAREAVLGKPSKVTYTSLPVLRDVDNNKREIVFFRGLDSEPAIFDAIADDAGIDEAQITSFRLFSLLDMCPSCGGVTLPQLFDRLANARTFAVRYLREYHASSAAEPTPAFAAPPPHPAQPDPALSTYYRQWRRGLQGD